MTYFQKSICLHVNKLIVFEAIYLFIKTNVDPELFIIFTMYVFFFFDKNPYRKKNNK